MSAGILFYGDPHGMWRPLYRACEERHPAAVVIVGDCDLDRCTLRDVVQPIVSKGTKVRWIPGNHDVDSVAMHDNLFGTPGNISGTYAALDGRIVAGLGGIFAGKIWYPQFELSEPVYKSRKDYLRQVRPTDRFRHGLPLHMRATIFPEDIGKLSGIRADVLVTHESPSCHPHGFVAVDKLAESLCARLIVHGHHHTSYRATLPSGICVVGLARAEVFVCERDV